MRNKNGGVGSLVVLLVSTIIIAIILIGFIVIAGIIKAVGDEHVVQAIYEDKDFGISDVTYYMGKYEKLIMVEKFVSEGKSVDDAINSAGYDYSIRDAKNSDTVLDAKMKTPLAAVWAVLYG